MIFRPTEQLPTERVNDLRKMLGSPAGQDLVRVFSANAQVKSEKLLQDIISEARGNVPDDPAFHELVDDACFYTRAVNVLKELAGESGEIEYIINNDNA